MQYWKNEKLKKHNRFSFHKIFLIETQLQLDIASSLCQDRLDWYIFLC